MRTKEILLAAKNEGIVTGNTDGSFGIGKPITRAEMAAMTYRGVLAVGKILKEIKPAELFAPNKNSQGTQAAKVIYGLVKAIGP